MNASAQPTSNVAVVLCTRNGARWIEEQIESILSQSYPVAIRVFDDASTDDTVERIETCTYGHDVECIVRTKPLGVVNNFADGIQHVLDEGFAYIALADQDDIWASDRIQQGLDKLQDTANTSVSSETPNSQSPTPQLAHSDLAMMNAHNQVIHKSFMRWRNYQTSPSSSLATVLGQNGVMGNTILMNRELAELALPFPIDLHVHDYWLALVAELLGQRHYIDKALVRYRIHDKNVSNSAGTVNFGLKRWFQGLSVDGLLRRDFRLPFKEDSRHNAVRSLLKDPRFKHLDKDQKATIRAFSNYLAFDDNRRSIALSVFKHKFIRPGLRHRLRVIVSILTSQRYQNVETHTR